MIVTIAFVFGAMIGSFLNVCIYRMPRGISVVLPRSHCPNCKQNIPFYLNIPIIAWLILKGKSSCCKQQISVQYPIVELLGGIFAATAFHMFSPQLASTMFIFLSFMLVAFFIDLQFMIIPDEISIIGAILGLLLSFLIPEIHDNSSRIASFISSANGMLLGSGLLLWIALTAEVLLKKEAMGMGDIKLIGCIGSFLGINGCLFSIFAGATIGTLILLPLIVLKKFKLFSKINISFGAQIPFGPFLVAGSVVYVFFAKNYFAEYINAIKLLLLT